MKPMAAAAPASNVTIPADARMIKPDDYTRYGRSGTLVEGGSNAPKVRFPQTNQRQKLKALVQGCSRPKPIAYRTFTSSSASQY